MITCDANHVYRDDAGVRIPGVTETLAAAGVIDSRWFDDYSRDRGSLVHDACALYDKNDLDILALDVVLQPYVAAWITFLHDSGFDPGLIERVVHNPAHNYAGKLDRTGRMAGCNWVLDIKTGKPQAWTAIQTAAYAGCLLGAPHRASVELMDDGNYRPTEYKDRSDWAVWLSCLAIANWKHNHGGMK